MKYSTSPAYSFPQTEKLKLTKIDPLFNPGPQNYSPQKLTIRFPITKIGRAKRESEKKEPVPGPGSYNIPSKFPTGFKYTMARRYSSKKKSELYSTPGPGSYNTLRKSKSCLYSIGLKHKDFKDLSSPGPGNYNIRKSKDLIKSSYIFGKEKRLLSSIVSYRRSIPGPGQYNKTDLNFYKPKQPSIKIGKYKRFVSSFELSNTPGPGKYNLSNSLILLKKVEPSWKIGTAKRRPLIEIDKYVPGPSKYNVIKKTKESPKYTIGLKFKIKKDEDTPGVGRYNINNGYTLQHSPSWKIGTEKKLKNLKYYKDTPGPGAYNTNSAGTFRAKFGYTKEKRGYLAINNFPGPGAYHIPCSFEELNTYTRRTGKFNEEFRYI